MTPQEEQVIRDQARADGVTHFSTGIAAVYNSKILVVRRVPNDFLGGSYELPGGGVEPYETFVESAIRELFEETGLTVRETLGTFEGFYYETPRKPKVLQINFKVSVSLDEIRLEPTEHDAYRWVSLEDISELETNDVMRACLARALA